MAVVMLLPASLATAQTGSITGTVHASTGEPLAIGINVYNSSGSYLFTVGANSLGQYTVNTTPGTYYLVTGGNSGHLATLYPNLTCVPCDVRTGTPLTISAGQTLTNINFTVTLGGRISGTITGPSGPIAGVDVGVYVYNGSFDVRVGTTQTNAAGQYSSVGLPTGTYFVRTLAETTAHGFINELYNNIVCPYSCMASSGAPVSVTFGAITPGIDFALTPGGVISGTVLGAGTPLASASVYVYDATGSTVAFTSTDASGIYNARGLPTGNHFVKVTTSQNFINELYDNIVCAGFCDVTRGTPIAVTAGVTESGRNFDLAPGGQITGTVRNGATPLSGITVNVVDAAGSSVVFATTDSSGVYTARGLPGGRYFVRTSSAGSYVAELYDNLPCLGGFCTVTAGTPVEVAIGAITGGIDFDLVPGGSISGTITNAAGGAPLSGVFVSVTHLSGTSATSAGGSSSNTSGQFTVSGLPSGTYVARTSTGQTYISEFYNDIKCVGNCPSSMGTAIPVSVGATTTGIDFALDAGATITGTVTGPGGAPLPNITVAAYDANGFWVTSTTTNTAGQYTLRGLLSAGYRVQSSNNQGFINKAYPNVSCGAGCASIVGSLVAVTAGATTSGIDLSLEMGGRISGVITGEGGTPLAGVSVSVYVTNGFFDTFVTSGTSNADGVYVTSSGLATGTYYARTNNAREYINEQYDNIECPGSCFSATGTPIDVTQGQTRTGIDFALVRGGSITGRVTSGSMPIALASVNIYNASGTHLLSATTNSLGQYSAVGLPAGTYFARIGSAQNSIREIFDNIPCRGSCTASSGTPITVAVGATTSGIDFDLDAGGTISGVVTSGATPLSNVWVAVYDGDGLFVAGMSTNSSGQFSIGGFPTGRFFVRTETARNLGYIDELYNNIPCLGFCPVTAGTPIEVTAGVTSSGISFDLAAGGVITGRVINEVTSAGIANMNVAIYDVSGTQVANAFTTVTGDYTVRGLTTGTYFARTTSQLGYVNELYDNLQCLSTCPATSGQPIAVSAGATTGEINFALRVGGSISGTITDTGATPQPLTGISVQVRSTTGEFLASASTNPAGQYSVGGLPSGTYYVQTSNSLGYVNELYDDVPCLSSCSITGGTSIVVVAGAATPNVNFALELGGRISGTIRSDDGAPIPYAFVTVHDSANVQVASASADWLGRYTTGGGLPTGRYYARIGSAAGYMSELYDDIPCFGFCDSNEGTPIAVTAGVTTSGIDFALAIGGRISGTIRGPDGAPLQGISITIYNSAGQSVSFGFTGPLGTYLTSAGLPTGQYFARTFNSRGFINEAYDDIPCLNCTATSGTSISVTRGSTTNNIDFTLANGGSIGGTITADGTTVPLAGVSVSIYDASGAFVSSASSNALGAYVVGGLPSGTYYAVTSNALGFINERWDNGVCLSCRAIEGSPIGVTIGQRSTANFSLAAGGRIAGRVTAAADGSPVSGVQVRVYNAEGTSVGSVQTNTRGEYITGVGLPSGPYYVSTFNSAGLLDEIYNDIVCLACTPTTGEAVAVTAGATRTGIDFSLGPGGSVSGTVSSGAASLANVSVRIYNRFGVLVNTAFTNSRGFYRSTGLPTGSYYAATSNSQGYIDERYQLPDNAPCLNCPPLEGTSFGVTIGETATINFDLAPGGRISGTIRGPDNSPLANVSVNIVDQSGRSVTSGYTNSAGTYITYGGLPTGTYFAKTSNWLGYLNEIYDDAPCQSCATNTGTPIEVTAGVTTSNINFVLAIGGRISGRVTDQATGQGISGVGVSIYDGAGLFVGSGTTSTTGSFITSGLPTGTYFARTSNSRGYIDQIHAGIVCIGFCLPFTGTPITVAVGGTTAGIDFALMRGGEIRGQVRGPASSSDGTLVPLPGVSVTIFNAAGSSIATVSTNSAGEYRTLTGLPPGQYFARTFNSLGYINELYHDIPCLGSCVPTNGRAIDVTLDQPSATANFELAIGGRIAGTVRDDTGAPLQSVTVNIINAAGARITGGITNSAGRYLTTDGLPTGAYFATTSNQLGYLDERYQLPHGIRCDGLCAAGVGTAIDVTAPDTTANIDFSLELGGRFGGRVTEAATSNPIRGVVVEIFTAGGFRMGGAFTDAYGRYVTPGLPDGSYYAQTNNSLGFADGRSTVFTVIGPAITPNIDFALSPGARISGRVANTSGAGTPGVSVQIYDSSNFFVAGATSGADGQYRIGRGLNAGTYYARTFNNAGLIDETFDNIVCIGCPPNSGTPITVSLGESRTNVNFVLDDGARIAGRVTHATSDGALAAVTVQAFALDGRFVRSARSDDAGRYEMLGLPTGSYYVRTFNTIGFIDQIHNDIECSYGAICPVTSGVPVEVTAGEVRQNINFSLRPGGRITGIVTDAGGRPLTSARITVFDLQGRVVTGATTDGAGRYLTGTGLPSGTYFAIAGANGFIKERYNDQACFPQCVVTEGTAIEVSGTTTTPASVDFALSPGGRISGRITEAGSSIPIANVSVGVYAPGLTAPFGTRGHLQSVWITQGVSDASGTFLTQDGLAPGRYLLRTSNNAGLVNELYDNLPCPHFLNERCGTATEVEVIGTNTTTGVDFGLARGPRIRGRVTDKVTGAPLPNVVVFFTDSEGKQVANTALTTDVNGRYQSLSGLPDGTYYVSTRNQLNYVDEVWVAEGAGLDRTCVSSRCDVTRGSPITVAGADVNSIDFALSRGGQIAGRVRGRTIAGALQDLPNVTVEIYGRTGIFLTSFITDGGGRYEMTGGLPPEKYFVKTVNEIGYIDELYNNIACEVCDVTTGTEVIVAAEETTRNVNFELSAGGSITGSVFKKSSGVQTDLPLPDAPVVIKKCPGGGATCSAPDLQKVARTRSNDDGVYKVSLPPGVYFVQTDAMPGFKTSIWKANGPGLPGSTQPCPRGLCDPGLGSPIDMSLGTTVTQINLGVDACSLITLSPAALSAFSPGTPYSRTIVAIGGSAPYGFEITSGQLPPGLTLNNETGVLSGTSTALGSTLFTISATDLNGCSGSQTYSPTLCSVAPGSTAVTVGDGAGSGVLPIIAAGSDCHWTVTSDSPWLTVSSTSGSGSGSITYTYQARGPFTQPRTGTIAVGGQSFRVTQTGIAPTFSVSPAAALFGPAAGAGAVQLTTNTADAAWTATTNAPWITIAAPSGTGSSSIAFVVARNSTTAARVGNIFVGGQTVTVTQRANGIPGAPLNLDARVTGGRAQFTWAPPIDAGDATSYVLEAGLTAGTTAISFTTTDGQPTIEVPLAIPPGRYYFRVKGRNEFGTGVASDEYELVVVGGTNPPGPPVNVVASITGTRLTVTWDAPLTGGTPTGYILEAGSGPSRSDIAVLSLGPGRTFTYDAVPPGNFFIRIRATNGAGSGEPSADVLLNAGGVPSPPGAPQTFAATVTGSTVTFSWLAPANGGAPTSYVLEAGSGRGLSNIAVFNTGGTATTISFNGVPSGVYYVRLRAQNAQGVGVASNEIRIVIP